MPIIRKDSDGYSDSEDSGMDSKDGMAKEDSDDSASCLIPKSVLHGKKVEPGDKVILEVVHIYEDEVEVKYGSKEKESKSEDEDEGESQMDVSQKELDTMAEE